MMYPYMTLSDETEIVHSQLLKEGDAARVEVHFERPRDGGFDTARCSLPDYTWLIREGFSDADIANFTEFLRNNAHLLFRFAERGGVCCA